MAEYDECLIKVGRRGKQGGASQLFYVANCVAQMSSVEQQTPAAKTKTKAKAKKKASSASKLRSTKKRSTKSARRRSSSKGRVREEPSSSPDEEKVRLRFGADIPISRFFDTTTLYGCR